MSNETIYQHYLVTRSLHYPDSLEFVRADLLKHRVGFRSLYAVTEETAKAVNAAGTTAKFSGVVWGPRLWLDIDSYDEAQAVEDKLRDMRLDFVAFDSGGKGAHFGILRDAAPSHLLPLQDKAWAAAHFPQADSSIYTHLHLFRLEGTKHQITGRKKSFVASGAGEAITVAPLSKADREPVKKFVHREGRSIFDSIRVLREMVPTTVGNRHATLTRLTYALRDSSLDEHYALFLVEEVNKMCEVPKEQWELEKLVRSIYDWS